MKVLQVSHSPFGGVGVLVTNLTIELAKQCVEVGWFYPGEYDLLFRPYVRRSINQQGVRLFALRNSPNLHIAQGLTHPEDEINQPSIESRFDAVLKEFRPDIVHFHDFGGLCSSLIGIAGVNSVKTVNSHHSYWFICPKQDLIFASGPSICSGPNADSCVRCLPYPVNRSRLNRARFSFGQRIVYRFIPAKVRKRIKEPLLKIRHQFQAFAPLRDTCEDGKNIRGKVTEKLRRSYVEREKENLRLMSQEVSLNIAVSSFVKRRFVEWGVPSEKFIVQHIGTHAAEFLKPVSREIKPPIVFGFIGPWNYNKGLHILIESYNRLSSDVKARLIVYGEPGVENEYGNKLKEMNKKPSVEFRGRYHYEDLQRVLSEIDVLVVPPVWYDNAPQVVFEGLSAGIPIIGARIGGIPDFVRDGENGMLFEAGNVNELVKKMSVLANDSALIMKFRDGIRPMKTMREHAFETISLYHSLIDG